MKVTILVPTENYIEEECYNALLNQTFKDRTILIHQLKPIELDSDPGKNKTLNSVRNRNEMRKAALGTDSTHFLMVDSDTVLPLNALETLLSKDKDIISGWSPIIGKPYWIAGRWKNNIFENFKEPQEGVIEVDMAALGCMLVKREVLEKIEFKGEVDVPIDTTQGKMSMGITAKFGLDAQKLGYKLYVDGSVICRHIVRIEKTKLGEPRDAMRVLQEFCVKEAMNIMPVLADPVKCSDGSIIIKPALKVSLKEEEVWKRKR